MEDHVDEEGQEEQEDQDDQEEAGDGPHSTLFAVAKECAPPHHFHLRHQFISAHVSTGLELVFGNLVCKRGCNFSNLQNVFLRRGISFASTAEIKSSALDLICRAEYDPLLRRGSHMQSCEYNLHRSIRFPRGTNYIQLAGIDL